MRRIYINFCDPWPKSRDAKLRLTAPNFLRMYADVLGVGGEIHFKTDNTPLFDWSAEQLSTEGWELHELDARPARERRGRRDDRLRGKVL